VDLSSANTDNTGQANVQASLSGRYATALFELARDGKAMDAVEKSLASLSAALSESSDFQALISNPLISRTEAMQSIAALAKAMKLDALTTRTLGVLAQNRRLGSMVAVIAAFRALAAAHRGETTADVVSAHALSPAQITALKAKLKAKIGRDVAVNLKVDPEILGGLTIKIGSQMIDSSIRTRLNTLAVAMKG
jgi:F-type H+-transporting ATPase subunit delta